MSIVNIKYSPCKSETKNTAIVIRSATDIEVDGVIYTFDFDGIKWPDVAVETDYAIIEAHRAAGELFLTVRRFYTGSCSDWDSGAFHDEEIS